MSPRPGFDLYFLGIARAVAARADCSRAQHGAVIVQNRRIVATGYNGAPSGVPGCLEGHCPRASSGVPSLSGYDNCIAVHAEANALLYADRDGCEGSTIYITGEPCLWCQKLIRASGIGVVIWPTGNIRFPGTGISPDKQTY